MTEWLRAWALYNLKTDSPQVRLYPETFSQLNQILLITTHQRLQPIKLEVELKQDLCRSTPKPMQKATYVD